MRLELEGLPPSTNSAYVYAGRQRVLSTEGKQYKQKVRLQMLQQLGGDIAIEPGHWYSVDVSVYFKALHPKTKKAKHPILLIDVANREKLLLDVLSEILGVNDAIFKKVVLEKHEDAREHVVVTISKYLPFYEGSRDGK